MREYHVLETCQMMENRIECRCCIIQIALMKLLLNKEVEFDVRTRLLIGLHWFINYVILNDVINDQSCAERVHFL